MANKHSLLTLPKKLPENPEELEQLIANHEEKSEPLRSGAEAKIIWYDKERRQKTPYSIVYLHGFKGTRGGGAPVHQMVAQLTGCNLYLGRLAEHGKKDDQPLANLTLPSLIRSATDACRVGKKIGENVILMGTSLGGGLCLYLAGTQPYSHSVAAAVLYSPLIHIYGRYSLFLEHNISRRILQMVLGEDHIVQPGSDASPEILRIWNSDFHLNGAFAIGKFAQKIMTRNLFQQVTCPVFAGYYYKNTLHFDRTVSVSSIKKMVRQLGTPDSKVTLKNFPEAHAHVLSSLLVSDAVNDVFRSTIQFLTQHLPLSISEEQERLHP